MQYEVILKLNNRQTLPIDIEAENWTQLIDYVYKNLEIQDLNNDLSELLDADLSMTDNNIKLKRSKFIIN